MLKIFDKYIQNKINSVLDEKLPKQSEEEPVDGFFYLPEADRNALLARTLQKTQNDVIPTNFDGTTMDGALESSSKLNSAYAIYGQVNDIIYTHFAQQGFIGFQACALLAQNWLINKCCVLPPKDAMAPDYEVSYKSKKIKKEDKEILSELKTISDAKYGFGIKDLAQEFAEKKRQFGVAYAYPLVLGVNYEKPFDLKSIKPGKYQGMVNVDPYWLTPELDFEASTNSASPNFYEPTWYRLPDGKRLHKSWVVKAVNGNLPDILKPTYCYGGYSIPQLIYQRVFAAESVANEAPMLAKSKRLLYMDGNLSNYVLNQNKAENDAKAFSYFRDNWGVVVKRPDQAIGQIDTSLTDFDAVMMSQYQLVAAASGVHATKLLETQPKGFNTSGDFETAQYNALLASIEKEDFKPYLNFHYKLLLKSLYDKEHVIDCEFNPIDTPTSKEVAECNEIKSRTNMTYVSAGVISADECRENLRLDPESGFNSLTGDAPEKGKKEQAQEPQAPQDDSETPENTKDAGSVATLENENQPDETVASSQNLFNESDKSEEVNEEIDDEEVISESDESASGTQKAENPDLNVDEDEEDKYFGAPANQDGNEFIESDNSQEQEEVFTDNSEDLEASEDTDKDTKNED